jgi:hypothetical protein
MTISKGSLFLGVVISFAATLLVFAGAAVVSLLMAVALNGFSERRAAPYFVGLLVLVCGVNFALLYLANTRFAKLRAGASGSLAAVFTALPFAIYLAWVLVFASKR